MTNTLPPPHWAADPSRRHELRYWDGTRWTDHVADGGVPSVDPVGEPAPADQVVASARAADTGIAPGTPLLRPPPPPPTVVGFTPNRTGSYGRPAYWRSLTGLRTALVVLFGASIASAIGVAVALSNRLDVIHDLRGGFTFELARRAQDSDDAVSTAVAISTLVFVATAVVFIIWQWRMAKNAELLGAQRPRFTPGWSIGAWFIPLANFVIPLLIFQDLWRASTPAARPDSWRREEGSFLVGVWWTLFVLANVVSRTVNTDDGDSLDALRTTNEVLRGTFVLTIVAAALAIVVVVRLTRRFEARRAELGAR